MIFLCIAAATAVAAAVQPAAQPAPSVQLRNGATVVGAHAEDGTEAFLGMRYAEPPTGELRFAPPRPLRVPAPGTVINASAFGSPCIQAADPSQQPDPEAPWMDEDCLFINAWRPAAIPPTSASLAPWTMSAPLPTMRPA